MMITFFGISANPQGFERVTSDDRRHLCAVDGHVATDTGGIKGYCRHCDIDMWFDRKTALFTIYDPFDKVNNGSAEV